MTKELDSIYNQTVNDSVANFTDERILLDPKLEGSINQLRKAMIETFEPNKLKSQTKYKAIVLAQLPTILIDDKKKIRVLARIPELHTLLPLPEHPHDYIRMMSYPQFVSEDDVLKDPLTRAPLDSIPKGATVEVSFGNNTNFSDPRLLRVVSILPKVPPGATGPDSTAASLANRDGAGTRDGVPTPAGFDASTFSGTPEEKAKAAREAKIEAAKTKATKPNPTLAEITSDPIPETLASWIVKQKDFNSSKRRRNVDLIIMHDSCSSTTAKLLRDLKGHDPPLGTHFSVGPHGKITQYVSIDRRTAHAAPWNDRSIGMDMVVSCRYNGRQYGSGGWKKQPKLPKTSGGLKLPRVQRISYFPFGWLKQLVIPNASALEKAYLTVLSILKAKPTIPRKFPAAREGGMYFGSIPANSTGIVAHGQLSNNRSDGRVVVYYMWLRSEHNLSPAAAYQRVLQNMWALATAYKKNGPGKYPSRLVPATPLTPRSAQAMARDINGYKYTERTDKLGTLDQLKKDFPENFTAQVTQSKIPEDPEK
tara:strand:+ start:9879 stop:11486 length:1608 start_codon:yes stop_codon:yes gene_type:complete